MKRIPWLVVAAAGAAALLVAATVAVITSGRTRDSSPPLALLPTPGVPRNVVTCGSYATEWAQHTIHAAADGADGVDMADVDGDSDLDLLTPYEGGAAIRISFNPGPAAVKAAANWTTITIATSVSAAEGACWGDFDDDGLIDAVGVGQTGVVAMRFNPGPGLVTTAANWTATTITAAAGLNRGYMTCAPADIDNDGRDDLVLGGISGTSVGDLTWFKQPSSGPRTGASWTRNVVESTGRVMSLAVRNFDGVAGLDIMATDREAGGTGTGLFVMRNTDGNGGTWARTNIMFGGSPARMMFTLGDLDDDGNAFDLCGGTDDVTWNGRCFLNVGTMKWTQTVIRPPVSVGIFQHATIGDINRDGYPDVAVSFSTAPGPTTGLAWFQGPYWIPQLVDTDGVKYDNLWLTDLDGDTMLDIVATEQDFGGSGTGLGALWFENPCSAGWP